MTTTDTDLTREESAYLYLAGFGKGAEVTVVTIGRSGETVLPGIVTTPQRDGEDGTGSAYLTVTGRNGHMARVTVSALLSGDCRIAGWDDAADGYWGSF
jgi:hypothetical protein